LASRSTYSHLPLLLQLEAVETNMRAHREVVSRNTQGFRAKLGELNTQKATLAEEKKQLEVKVAALEKDLTTLQASQTSTPDGTVPDAAQKAEISRQNALIVRFFFGFCDIQTHIS